VLDVFVHWMHRIIPMELRTYLAERGETPSAFARRVDRAHSTILRLMDRQTAPSAETVRLIFDATDGQVTASDLFGQTGATSSCAA
jgi:hypothetical protein